MTNQTDHLQQPIAHELDLSPFVHDSPMAVAYELRQLAQRATSLAVYFNQGQGMMLTRILDVDSKARQFVFDLGGHPPTNDALQKADKILMVAAPEGVKIQFAIGGARTCSFEGKPAFIAAFPPSLIKLQRREYFRLTTPMASPYRCQLKLASGANLTLELHDLSLGGFGAWLPVEVMSQIEVGQQFSDAWFELGPLGQVKISLEIRSLRAMTLNTGPRCFVGAKFLGVSRTVEASLQRLMVQLERDRKALLD